GIEHLIECFPEVRRGEPDAVLVVAGFPTDDFDVAGARALARRLGLEDAFRLAPGYVPAEAVRAWMRLAEVMALPHRAVYQSGALVLAQTFGVPVVATR